MCMNCGCGEPETRHKATDITSDDVKNAAAGGSLETTVKNMRTSLDQMGKVGSGKPSGSAKRAGSGQQQGGSFGQSGGSR